MKEYNLYDVRAQLKSEDAKGYLTLKNVMPTQDAEYYEKYPITVDALHVENGTEMKVYLVGDEAWLDKLIANKGHFVDSHEVEYYNVDKRVSSILRSCKVRIL